MPNFSEITHILSVFYFFLESKHKFKTNKNI